MTVARVIYRKFNMDSYLSNLQLFSEEVEIMNGYINNNTGSTDCFKYI